MDLKPRRNKEGPISLSGPCLEEGCEKPRKSRGRCTSHYNRLRIKERAEQGRLCQSEGCENAEVSRGFCSKHYQREKKAGNLPGVLKSRSVPMGEWGYAHNAGHGYVRVKMRTPEGDIFAAQHRLVMEQHLGRPLTPDESVHHKNGDRADNRIENLELWSRYQPAGQRVEDKVAWAKELLALYDPEALRQAT